MDETRVNKPTTYQMVATAQESARLAACRSYVALQGLEQALATGGDSKARRADLAIAKAAEAYAWSVFQSAQLDSEEPSPVLG